LLLAAVALAFDAADRRIPFGVWTTGPVDEVAHLATAALGLLVLARFTAAPRRFYVAALIASVAIDVDHIPLYLGLLGNQAQRPVTHSLTTVAVFAAAAAVSRKHRAVLGGVATGLALHFARDIAEGYPGVRVFWPLQDTSLMASYWWFLGMIVVFSAARLMLVSTGLPHTRIPVFRTPSPSGSTPRSPASSATSGDSRPGLETQRPGLEAAREARPRTSLRSSSGGLFMAADRLRRRRYVIPVQGCRLGGSGSSGPGRECAPRGGRGLPTIGLAPAAERAHRTLARRTRPAAARTRRTHLSRVAAT
jgi:membrane-bound metal-dependent hydrolase YbcI (DUF457 family)